MLRKLPAAVDLRRILSYDPLTGLFRWKFRPELDARWNNRWAGSAAGSINIRGYVTSQSAGFPTLLIGLHGK